MSEKLKADLSVESSKYPKELDEVVKNAAKLIESIQKLRCRYIKADMLPLLPFRSDCENMMVIAKAIGQEAMKFGLPGITEFCIFDEEELKKISKDDNEMKKNGLDEWVEEGLFDRDFYVSKPEAEEENLYKKFMQMQKIK
ncbi:MAG: hypothetical protein A2Y24_01790 [Clostridiales bacterium GWE2_32_10]|nr:MAG: hypothetical protein A2Y24_01790 [Clostridiales bacterium GWE2_32_10]HBY20041.1 hypothetical protein [Clostridiales bacterium]